MDRVESVPRYSRTPPLMFPRRPNERPLILKTGKSGQVNPIIGITRTPSGTWSVRTPKIESTFALYAGWKPKWLPSTRTPYWNVGRPGGAAPGPMNPGPAAFILKTSPSPIAPVMPVPLVCSEVRVREKLVGVPFAKSSSELNAKVPKPASCWTEYPSSVASSVSATEWCRSHVLYVVALRSSVDQVLLSLCGLALPPTRTFEMPTPPSDSPDASRMFADGRSRYGFVLSSAPSTLIVVSLSVLRGRYLAEVNWAQPSRCEISPPDDGSDVGPIIAPPLLRALPPTSR